METNGVPISLCIEQWHLRLIDLTRPARCNRHFVVDVGGAYLTAGASLLWAALRPRVAFPLITMTLLFSLLHAGNHVYEYLSYGNPTRAVVIELFGIWAPVLLLAGLSVATAPRAGDRPWSGSRR